MTNDGMMLLQKNNKHTADTDNDDGKCYDRFLTLFSVLNSQTSYKLSKPFFLFFFFKIQRLNLIYYSPNQCLCMMHVHCSLHRSNIKLLAKVCSYLVSYFQIQSGSNCQLNRGTGSNCQLNSRSQNQKTSKDLRFRDVFF